MAGASTLFAGASMGLDLLSGLVGMFTGEAAEEIADSRARMIRLETAADAQRYDEQMRTFKSGQKLAYLKSGVRVDGSVLDVLDETERVTRENLSAIHARGRAEAAGMEFQGDQAAAVGRAEFIRGVAGATSTGGRMIFA